MMILLKENCVFSSLKISSHLQNLLQSVKNALSVRLDRARACFRSSQAPRQRIFSAFTTLFSIDFVVRHYHVIISFLRNECVRIYFKR